MVHLAKKRKSMIDCNSSAWSADMPLTACFDIQLANANVIGPIEPAVQDGVGPYEFMVKLQAGGRTIVLTGNDLSAPPATVTDTAGIVTSVTGDLGSFTLDRLQAQIYPQDQLTAMITVTDATGAVVSDMVSYTL